MARIKGPRKSVALQPEEFKLKAVKLSQIEGVRSAGSGRRAELSR